MWRFSWIVLIFPFFLSAQENQVKRGLVKNQGFAKGRWEMGVHYLRWNEKISLVQGAATDQGFANYAGWGVKLERNWTRYRWRWGAGVFLEAGQAGSGGYQGNVAFDDGVKRPWKGYGAELIGHYRANAVFAFGLGALMRYRQVSWEPSDTSVAVEAPAEFSTAPELDFRWQIFRNFSLVQTYAILDYEGSSFWRWSFQANF